MNMCVMAGFNLKREPWIKTYLANPDFIEYTDYYVKIATYKVNERIENSEDDDAEFSSLESSLSSSSTKNTNSNSPDLAELMEKTDQEINDLLNLDEYYFERFHLNKNKSSKKCSALDSRRRNTEVAKNIYKFIEYFYTNPLSLKELARIQIRKSLLAVDYKMKYKIEDELCLPKRLKDYLLLKEFNL